MNVLLVVTEEGAVRESLRAAVSETDLVLFESSAEDALRRLIAIKADALIVDDTPALGRRAVAQLAEAASGTPILALSTRSDPESLAGLNLAGARATLVKPFSCGDLLNTLNRIVHGPGPSFESVTTEPTQVPNAVAISQHQTALRWLSRAASQIKDVQSIGQGLVHAIMDIFDPVRCAIVLEADGACSVAASHGVPPALVDVVRLGFSEGLMRWFEANPCLTDRATNRDEAAVKEMQVLGARLGVPLLCSGRVAGAILVGSKAAGRDYSLEERELLTIVARCAAVSLENARLYRDVSHQQRRLDALLAHVTAGVVVVAVNKTVSMINQSAERILQLRAVDVLGRSVQKLGSGFADIVLRVLEDKKPRLRQEVRDPAINASLGLSAAPIGAEGVAVIFSRLPEERTPTEDIAYSPFWEFLASRVAQEIKNPLVAVNTFAQLLPDKYDSADFRDAFGEVVQKEVGRINNVVETLFEFAQHPRLVLRSCDVNETVQNVLKSFEQELDSRAIAVRTELDPALPFAELDPRFFSQAVHNVVQNSLEAMPSGGTLTVRTRKRDHECEVVITDTGPGVSEQDAPMIFAPFFSTKEQGMGLGLTVADRIMRQHEGGLSLVTSEEGGSAFSFRVPSSRTTNADSPRR